MHFAEQTSEIIMMMSWITKILLIVFDDVYPWIVYLIISAET